MKETPENPGDLDEIKEFTGKQPKIANRTSLIDRQKQLISERPEKKVVGQKAPTTRTRPLAFKTGSANEESKSSVGNSSPVRKSSKPVVPSKFLDRIMAGQFRSFSERLEQREAKKRVEALTRMRVEWRRRVNLVQGFYRHKKFGDPLPETKKVTQENIQDMWEDK